MIYNNLSGYLREKYGKRLKKICIDGGFTCPNRDGKCSTGGCIFCGERGAGEHLAPRRGIREQVGEAISAARADDEFIAYFQNFTNTYAPLPVLRERYGEALISERIRVLSVGTRPDCIDEGVARLLAEYAREREVWVELGLQTANDETARLINRGYARAEFERAMQILKGYGLRAVVHLMIGLPKETMSDVRETAAYVARFAPFGVKLHSVYVMRGTRLAELYERGDYEPPSFGEYTELAAEVIAALPSDTVIHRLTGDCPRGLLVAPAWSADKNAVLAEIRARLAAIKR